MPATPENIEDYYHVAIVDHLASNDKGINETNWLASPASRLRLPNGVTAARRGGWWPEGGRDVTLPA